MTAWSKLTRAVVSPGMASDNMQPELNYSEARLAERWQAALDLRRVGIAEAIADDIASYTGETVDVVLSRMATGANDFKALWESAGVDVDRPGSVAEFYRDQLVEAYELAQWHSGRTTGQFPLNYARAATFAEELGAESILDFGSGIGSGSLTLARTGADVYSADIAQHLLRLTGHRMTRHGYTPRLIDLSAQATPTHAAYDLITCFDVLEHIPDQLAKVKELQTYLRRGGRLLANFVKDSTHPDRPMHISSAGNWIRLIRNTGLAPDWDATARVGISIVARSPLGRFKNIAAVVLHGE